MKDIDDKKKVEILPLAICLEILPAIVGKIENGSLKAALDKVEAVWLRMSRPKYPSGQFSSVKITSAGEAEKVRAELKKLAKYIGFND